eukprot:scaffold127349_cov45-Phaeocystis_antarctica.AAC.1
MAHEAHAFMYSTARAGGAPRAARLTVPPSGDPTGEHGLAPSDDAGGSSSGEAVAAVEEGHREEFLSAVATVAAAAEPTTHQERLAAAMVAAAAAASAQLPEFLSGNSALHLEGNSLSR